VVLSPAPTASWCQAPRCAGQVAVMGPERIDGGRHRGALNRSRTGSGLSSPIIESMRISHEAIYQALYVQGRGALKRELVACLRTGRALRVPRARTRKRRKGFVRSLYKCLCEWVSGRRWLAVRR